MISWQNYTSGPLGTLHSNLGLFSEQNNHFATKYRWTINKNIILKTDFVFYLAGNVFNAYEQGWEPPKVCRIVAEKQSFKNSH